MTIRTELENFRKYKSYTGAFGVEIETEVKSPDDYPDGFLISTVHPGGHEGWDVPVLENYWIAHVDHSLRNFGVEYVFKEPYSLSTSRLALLLFESKVKDIPFLTKTPGTSVHVHLNFLDQEFVTLGNFVTLWILFENILVNYSGETRRSNLFALPTRCAEGVYKTFTNLFRKVELGDYNVLRIADEQAKYGAINPCTLWKYGSIEIRSFRGTTDVDQIYLWLKILQRMLDYARKDLTPPEIMALYNMMGLGFFFDVFQDEAEYLIEGIRDVQHYIDRNLFYAGLGIADSVKDWRKINTAISSNPNNKPKKKVINPPVSINSPEVSFYAVPANSEMVFLDDD